MTIIPSFGLFEIEDPYLSTVVDVFTLPFEDATATEAWRRNAVRVWEVLTMSCGWVLESLRMFLSQNGGGEFVFKDCKPRIECAIMTRL